MTRIGPPLRFPEKIQEDPHLPVAAMSTHTDDGRLIVSVRAGLSRHSRRKAIAAVLRPYQPKPTLSPLAPTSAAMGWERAKQQNARHEPPASPDPPAAHHRQHAELDHALGACLLD